MREIFIPVFNTHQHVYLTLRKNQGSESVSAERRGWFSRLFMKIGWHESSMKRIIAFLLEKENEITLTGPGLPDLVGKIQSYQKKHHSRSAKTHTKIVQFLEKMKIVPMPLEQTPGLSETSNLTPPVQEPLLNKETQSTDETIETKKQSASGEVEATPSTPSFSPEGLFGEQLWKLAAKKPIINRSDEEVRPPDTTLLVESVPTFLEKLSSWKAAIADVLAASSDEEIRKEIEEILSNLNNLSDEVELLKKEKLSSAEKDSVVEKFLEFRDESGRAISIYKRLEAKLYEKESSLSQKWIAELQSTFINGGNRPENQKILQEGITNLRRYLVHRHPGITFFYNETDALIVRHLLSLFFGIDIHLALKAFEERLELSYVDKTNENNWAAIARLHRSVNGNDFVTTIDSGGKFVLISPIFQRRYTDAPDSLDRLPFNFFVYIQREKLKELKDQNFVINPEALCVPEIEENSEPGFRTNPKYLLAVFAAFAVVAEYAKAAHIFDTQK